MSELPSFMLFPKMRSRIKKYLELFNIDEVDVLLVVPPFSLIEYPSIGLDILKTIANSINVKTSILYANLLFAEYIGVIKYKKISQELLSMHTMLGERLFANAADPTMPILGIDFLKYFDSNFNDIFFSLFSTEEITQIAEMANIWSDSLAEVIADKKIKVVGFTTGHQQTNATVSLINKIKERNNSIICIVGGSACDGEMAEGFLSLCPNADFIFSGESEICWKKFLTNFKEGVLPSQQIIKGEYLTNLDVIDSDAKSYNDYFKQINILRIIKESETSLLYKSSRACWWGEHHKCSFCGVNGWNKHYRYKSEEKVKLDLKEMLNAHPEVKHVQMVDTLMPRTYFKGLIGSLKEVLSNKTLFYEQRADLSLKQILQLKLCGIHYTQVGIEALSTNLLNLLNKGITAEQNINFLRHTKSVGLLVGWNLLTDIPNDRMEDWTQFMELIPMIYHLNPPLLVRPLEIVRFSPYFESPFKYNIQNIKPNKVYHDIFSNTANIEKIAWLFDADYDSYSKYNSSFKNQLRVEVHKWMSLWKNGVACWFRRMRRDCSWRWPEGMRAPCP